jgi:S1-C subfamily serine protease
MSQGLTKTPFRTASTSAREQGTDGFTSARVSAPWPIADKEIPVEHNTRHIGRGLTALGAVAILVAACGGSPATSPTTSSAPSAPASSAAFDLSQVEASVAYIQTQGTFITADGAKEQIFSGSGLVVDSSGLIVTNNHVVEGGAFWKVSVGTDKTLLDATLVGVSECSDLAVLKVAGTFPALAMSTTSPKVGTQIYVAGHPLGDTYTLTNGIIAKPAAPADTSWASIKSEIQITAQTKPGNSGSPVVDATGQVVGIQYASGAVGSDLAGESFAIASSEAKTIIDQIKAKGNLDYIGLNGEVNADNTGIAIVSVAPGSPADAAGILAGDLLTDLNGTKVGTDGSKATYCSVLRSHDSGATLSVTVLRNGQTLNGEINGRQIISVNAPAPSAAPAGSPADIAGINQLKPFVPSAIWSTCKAATSSDPTVVALANCTASGTDGVAFYLFSSTADLTASYAADVKSLGAKPGDTCSAGGNIDSGWHWTSQDSLPVNPDQGLLCAKTSDGALIEQTDPAINVAFVAILKSGDQVALFNWWKANDTIIEP